MDAFDSIHPVPAGWLRNSDLGAYETPYRSHLVCQGYRPDTVRVYTCCVAHFARWHRGRRRGIDHLGMRDVDIFLDRHLPSCSCPAPVQRSRHHLHAALRHLVRTLSNAGVLTSPPDFDPVERELREFDGYLVDARGLAANTRTQRIHILRPFLESRVSRDRTHLVLLEPSVLRRFITDQLQRWSPASAKVLASTLRSYVRYRAFCGDTVSHLLPVITSPANWRLSSLPETLTQQEVTELLCAFPSGMASARRAYAMVRCVVDLGLRASEVVSLVLEDIDWNVGTIRICLNKSRRVDALPLPPETGRAIAEYLRHERPHCLNRHVFVRHVAPVEQPILPGVVRRAVREAYERCGQSHTRVHVLRHTLAGRILESGGTLKEVADVLRHRALDTSLIYAKVDTSRLSAVPLPWPGSAA